MFCFGAGGQLGDDYALVINHSQGDKLKKVFSVITLTAAMLAGGALAAGPAQAAGCNYSSCANQDPVAQGCGADAYTIWAYPNAKEVRWSPSCQAAWLRSSTPAHIYGFDTNSTMRTYKTIGSQVPVYTKAWGSGDKKISNMIPLASNQFIQVELPGYYGNGGIYYPNYTPVLNTLPY